MPLSLLLVALVVLPTAGVSAVSYRETRARTAEARQAEDVQRLTEAFVALADFRTAISDENVIAAGVILLGTDTVAADPAGVRSVLGSDPAALLRGLGRASDSAFAQVEAAVLHPLDGTGMIEPALAEVLLAQYARVVANRDRLSEGGATFADTVTRFGEVDDAALDALSALATRLQRSSASLYDRFNKVAALTEAIRDQLAVASAMSSELAAASELVFSAALDPAKAPTEGELRAMRSAIQVATASLDKAETDATASLPAEHRDSWRSARSDERVLAFEATIAALVGDQATDLDIPSLAQQGLIRIQLASDVLADLLTEVADAAVRSREAAQDELRETLAILGGLVAVTLVSLVVVVVAISRPLRRLTARAHAVRDGALDPPERSGSVVAQIDDVETVFEDIVAHLRAVEEQATVLVDGRVDALDALDADRPGPLGVSVRNSLRRLAEVSAQLHASEALSNAIVETAAEAIWTLDANGMVQRTNAAAHALVGIGADAGWRFVDCVALDERDEVRRLMHGTGLDSFEAHLMRTTDSVAVPVLLSSSRVELDSEPFITVIARDITERKDFEAQLERNATTDPLSGLPNRRSAMAAIADALEQADRDGGVAVVFCDLDRFKEANDLYGHGFGDAVLREVARRFRQAIRPEDLVSRLGGDEFVVVIDGVTDAATAAPVATRLLESLRDPIVVGERRVRVSGSFGVAWAGGDRAASDVLRDADTAMFTAKSAGGSRVRVFDAELQRGLHERIDIETGLRRAMERDELAFAYQPVVRAMTNEIIGAEALVRWHRPGFGMVPPGAFIPVAEQSDLIVDIGRWGLHAAAAQLAAWGDLVPPSFYVAVNIAGVHLSRHDVVADVREAIERAGIRPAQLRVEITETQLVDDLNVAAEAMRRLGELGVSVVIDDYGTGFSSISYLRELPLRGIKIDRSFINRLGIPRERAMVESVVALARLLDLEVVAEGVETEEQQLLSERMGCGSLQGYHIARPMPADRLVACFGTLGLPCEVRGAG